MRNIHCSIDELIAALPEDEQKECISMSIKEVIETYDDRTMLNCVADAVAILKTAVDNFKKHIESASLERFLGEMDGGISALDAVLGYYLENKETEDSGNE